ncbi:MAG: hypothetical protein ACLPTJ_12000 [Solirubrobacteraceae bacterium]
MALLDAAVATGVEVVSLPAVAVAGAVAGVVLVAAGVVTGAEVVCVCVCVVEAWVVLPNGSVYC